MHLLLRRLIAAAASLGATLSFAAHVVVFADTNFVDYIPGNTDSEASNVVTSLTALGHSSSTFTGSTAAAWSTALNGQSILILPEFENNDATNLDAGVATVVQNFVNGGGHLIVMSDYADVLATLLGWPQFTNSSSGDATATPQKPSSIFAAGPNTVPDANGSYAPLISQLPATGICAYSFVDSPDEYCNVWSGLQGSGRVTHLAWDWYFDSEEPAQRATWENILNLAIGAGRASVAPTAVPTTNAAGLAALAALLLVAGTWVARRRA